MIKCKNYRNARLICFCLSVAILMCAIFQVGFKSYADDGNLARNPGFEQGSSTEAESWGLWPGWNTGSYISTETVHTGNRAIKVELKSSQNYALYAGGYRNSDFPLGNAMRVSMWVNYENLTGGFAFGLERKNNNQDAATVLSSYYTGNSNGWKQISFDIPATTLTLSEDIIKIEIARGSGTLFIDDVILAPYDPEKDPDKDSETEPVDTETEYIMNGDMEQGSTAEVSAWGLSSGWNAEKIVSDAVSGSRAVKITLNNSDTNLFQSSGWNPEKYDLSVSRKVTAKVLCTDVSGAGVFIRVEQKKNNITVAELKSSVIIGSTDGWGDLELIIPKNDESLTETVISIVAGAGSGTVLIDDVSMKNYVKEDTNPDSGNTDNPGGEQNPDTGEGDNSEDQNGSQNNEKPDSKKPQLMNGSFEEGITDAPGWGLTSGWNSSSFSSNAYDGQRSIVMTAGESEQNLFQSNKWNPDADYSLSSAKRITAMVKTEDLKGAGVSLRVERKVNDTGVANVSGDAVISTNGEWQIITLIVPATDLKIDELIVSVICGAGSGKAYIDSVIMEEYVPLNAEEPTVPQIVKDPNMLMNGGFEQGSASEVSGWGIGSGWEKNFITSDARSGGRAVIIKQGKQSVNLFQSNIWNPEKYSANTAKRITAWVKYSGLTETGVFLLAEHKADDKVVSTVSSTAVNGTSKEWIQLELIVPPVSGKVDEFVVSFVCSSGAGTVTVDDMIMTEYTGKLPESVISAVEDDGKLLRNGGLEKLNSDGSVYAWDVWPGDPAEGERHAAISTSEKHGGNQSLCVTLTQKNVQAVYQYTLLDDNRFDFQGAYVFSAWVKFDSVALDSGNNIRIGVKRKGADGNYYNLYSELDVSVANWHQVRIVVPKALVMINQYDVIFEIGAGTGNFYMDDMLLEPATEEDLASLKNGTDSTEKLLVTTKVLSTEKADTGRTNKLLPAAVTVSVISAVTFACAVVCVILYLRKRKLY